MRNDVVGIILAGGKGTRLEYLTKKIAKPAVSFAAKYRIIDFPLSNLAHSGISKVGVLTQYESALLDAYIGNGEKWGYNGLRSMATTLAPHQTEEGANWYKGTADAITQNISFIDSMNPKYVVILSGDHIYKTSYNEMIDLHISNDADVTISVIEVPFSEANRFGIMAVDEHDRIIEFQEKPKEPKSNLASMGVYVFTWKVLRKLLKEDEKNLDSEHDFGKNIIPTMLERKKTLLAYRFKGYWKDVGTIASLHEANMDIALGKTELDLFDDEHSIFTEDSHSVPQYIGKKALVTRSIVDQGAIILGKVDSCVISNNVTVCEKAFANRCVIMNNCYLHTGCKIENAIIAPGTIVGPDEEINVGSDKVILYTGSRKGKNHD